jgi:HlyD family secretion protein
MKLGLKLAGVFALAVGVGASAMVPREAWRAWFGTAPNPNAIEVAGNIEAHESVLGFKTVQSRIVELPFNEGQSVKTGTLLAAVDDTDYRQQVKLAESGLDVKQKSLASTRENLTAAQKAVTSDQADVALKRTQSERAQLLWEKNAVSTNDRDVAAAAYTQASAQLERDQALVALARRNIDLAEANVHDAEEQLALAKIVLSYTRLVAPIDGVITVRDAEIGEIVAPGTPVMTLADLDHVWLRAYIAETDLGKVKLGAPVAVTTDSRPGKTYQGRVSFIASDAEFTPKTVETQAQRVTLVYRIKIDIDNPTHELLPGMPADATIRTRP